MGRGVGCQPVWTEIKLIQPTGGLVRSILYSFQNQKVVAGSQPWQDHSLGRRALQRASRSTSFSPIRQQSNSHTYKHQGCLLHACAACTDGTVCEQSCKWSHPLLAAGVKQNCRADDSGRRRNPAGACQSHKKAGTLVECTSLVLLIGADSSPITAAVDVVFRVRRVLRTSLLQRCVELLEQQGRQRQLTDLASCL